MTIEELLEIEKNNKDYKECEPINASKKDIYEFARTIFNKLKNKVNDPADMYQIVDTIGGTLHSLELNRYDNTSGTIYINGKKDFDVIIPKYTSPVRDRFTLAHEIGHYFLHYIVPQKNDKRFAKRQESNRLEWEANWFAASFLMPANEIEEIREREGDKFSYIDIAYHFGVSMDAAQIRFKTFMKNGF